jgi:hypothetical protein
MKNPPAISVGEWVFENWILRFRLRLDHDPHHAKRCHPATTGAGDATTRLREVRIHDRVQCDNTLENSASIGNPKE